MSKMFRIGSNLSEAFADTKRFTLIAIGLSFLQTILTIIPEVVILLTINEFFGRTFNANNADAGSLPIIFVYFSLFIFAQLFQFVLVVDAALSLNSMQIIAVSVFNFVTTTYTAIQIVQIIRLKACAEAIISGVSLTTTSKVSFKDPDTNCKVYDLPDDFSRILSANLGFFNTSWVWEIALVAICGLCAILTIFAARETIRRWGWQIWKRSTGADVEKRYILQTYYFFVLFLKLNIFSAVCLITQLIVLFYYSRKETSRTKPPSGTGIQDSVGGTAITDIATLIGLAVTAVASVVYFFMGYMAVRKGSIAMMLLFCMILIATSFVAIAIIVVPYLKIDNQFVVQFQELVAGATIFLTVFSSICVLLNSTLLAIGFQSLRNFSHKEYREIVTPPKNKPQEYATPSLELE
ncbi:hypothetical protein BJ742DRAFT_824308 [Cladochytrium replicatum]|nr:hypothetical protein BJ742DRAFT_824308 [Cladochytrium replicatum]